jgi:hypothetical protein
VKSEFTEFNKNKNNIQIIRISFTPIFHSVQLTILFIYRYKGYIWEPDYDTFVANFTESVVEPLVAAAAALLILFI